MQAAPTSTAQITQISSTSAAEIIPAALTSSAEITQRAQISTQIMHGAPTNVIPLNTNISETQSACVNTDSIPKVLLTPKLEPKEFLDESSTVSKESPTSPLGEENNSSVNEPPPEMPILDVMIKKEIIESTPDQDETGIQTTSSSPVVNSENTSFKSVHAQLPSNVEKVPSPVPMPTLKMQNIVKESFLKLKLEGRAKMTAPSKGDSKQSQALLKLVMGSESSSAAKSNLDSSRLQNIHNMSKFAGLKTILNSVMKTSISKVLRTKMDNRLDAKPFPVEESKSLKDNSFSAASNVNEVEGPAPSKSNDTIRNEEVDSKTEINNTTTAPIRARKSIPPVKDSPTIPMAARSHHKTSSRTMKKHRKKFFKGATYNLYLSTKKKKKKSHLRDDESSITGTETTGSLVDSEDEAGSYISEECHSVSDTLFREETLSKTGGEDAVNQNVDKSDGEETEKGSICLDNVEDVRIKQEVDDETSNQKLDVIGDTKEDAAIFPTEEPAVPESFLKQLEDGVITRRIRERLLESMLSGKENISEKDRPQSIASSVKQRQRLKRRYLEDQVDMDVISIASSDGSSSLAKKSRRVTMPLTAEESHLSSELSEITNGFVPNMEILYTSKLATIVNCCCQEKPLVAPSEELSEETKIYCQAIDSIGRKLIGCCNTVTTKQLVRSSVRIPFTAMCEVHFWRLRHHHCCPTCGVFCSEGNFLQCRTVVKERTQIHLFHKNCKIIGENGSSLCPHCGSVDKMKEILLELNLPSAPAFYLTQKPVFIEPKARMSFSRQTVVPEVDDTPFESLTTLDSGKVLSSAGLPLGTCRTELEGLLEKMKGEKLDKTKYSIGDLFVTARSGDVETVLRMLILEFDPNTKMEENNKETPLHAAADSGFLSIVHLLIQAGASLDHVDEHLYTPLMHAVEKKKVAVVQYLIKAGAQLDAKGEDGMCGLHLAARGGNLEICNAFLNTGRVNVNIQDDGGWTPIVWAAEHRHLNIVRLLIERGADPNIRDNELNNALHWSAFSGNVEISQLFLDLGLKLTDVNEHGDTPLHIASRQNNYECVVLFLARGARVDAKNKENQMPIKCCPDPNSETYVALSMNYELKRFTAKRPLTGERVVYRDISRGKEPNPIQCVNGVDDDPVPTDFIYVVENCETSPISIDRTITSLQSCQCEDDCTSSNCTCATISFKCWYDNDGRLLPEFNLPDPPMIFECNRACLCWKNCNNRALQHGMPSRLQLFKTKGKGWGVRTLKDIQRGTFVCEYIGEIISDSEADQREDDSYLFDLDNRDGETYCLDARYYGNVSRFINHLCEPNLVPVKIFVEHQDLSFPRIAFFSSRDIKADEELGFDYGEKFWVIKYKWFTCTCGSAGCKYSQETIQETLENFRRAKDEHIEEDVVVPKEGW